MQVKDKRVLCHCMRELDSAIVALAKSDSSMEYAPHMRTAFDKLIDEYNGIRIALGFIPKTYADFFK